jgi:prolyl 4-hydroxylase
LVAALSFFATDTHHDYIEHDIERPQGVRILTVFLYLNDVEEGGGTNFPLLDTVRFIDQLLYVIFRFPVLTCDLSALLLVFVKTVKPQRGRVLLWPSVLNEDPNAKDFRTDHQALPVIKGTKYGANAWIHMRDFKAAHAINCI